MVKDKYYEILEVPETANADEIKKAFRRLSLKYHPDKNQGKTDSVEMFQKVNEAYEVLRDDEKKAEYDMMRKNPNPFARMSSTGPNMGHNMEDMLFRGMNNANMEELFSNLFGQGMGFPGMGGMGMGGFPPGMGGMGMNFPPGANVRVFRNGVPVNVVSKPPPIVLNLAVSMENVLTGANLPLEVERWIMEGQNRVHEIQKIYVKVEKGVDDNEMIILENQGNIINESCKGDIKVVIKVDNNSGFVRKGLDLWMDKQISLKEALCGFSFDLKYVNGKTYTINNQAGNIIPPEYQKVIANMGLTRESHVGNMIIHFHIDFPTTIPLEKIAILESIL